VGLDAEVATLAERQYGLIAARQARGLGLTRQQMQQRVERGVWERVRVGVFLIRGAPRSWPQTVMSAVLAGGDAAWASHHTAARLWRLPVRSVDAIEITTPLERRVRVPGVRGHRSGVWDERDVATLGPIPVTTAARTLADLSSELGEGGFGRALDEGLRRGVVSLSAVHAVAMRFGIAPGRSPSVMHAALALRIPGYGPGDSELETWVWLILREAGLPLPVRQHPIWVRGRRYVIDLAYPNEKVAIEADGYDPHRTRAAFDADRERDRAIQLDGWRTLHYTSRSDPAGIAADVREALFGQQVKRCLTQRPNKRSGRVGR